MAGFRATNWSWFRKEARLPVPEDAGGIYAHEAAPGVLLIPILTDEHARTILDECCTDGARVWEDQGTLTIPDMFSWLEYGVTVDGRHEPGVRALIDDELLMYLHHQRPINGVSNHGWLRNMFFGVTQQIARQDPGHWLAYVAARPDHRPQLVSYQYYVKYVFEKDSGTA